MKLLAKIVGAWAAASLLFPSGYSAAAKNEPVRLGFGRAPHAEVLTIDVSDERSATRDELASIVERYRGARSAPPAVARVLIEQQMEELEEFIVRNPLEEHTAGLRVELAYEYRKNGQFTRALDHWTGAAEAVKHVQGDGARKVLDHALVQRASLLASLGRLETLEALLEEHRGRVMSEFHLAQLWARAREAAWHMRRKPGIAYKCGVFALHNAVKQERGVAPRAIWDAPSAPTGFSLLELANLAEEHEAGFVPAFRAEGAEIIVPAVVHWRQDHYAAVLAKRDSDYLLVDPTFNTRRWIPEKALLEEASGYFMVPEGKLKDGWRRVGAGEGATIFGKGYPNFLDDDDEEPCPEERCCEPPEGPNGTGSGTNCPVGMATWRVIEPNINLVVEDIPLMYEPAYGPTFALHLLWRQRSAAPDNGSHFASGWKSDLLSRIEYDFDGGFDFYPGNGAKIKLTFVGENGTAATPRAFWASRTVDTNGVTVEVRVHYTNGALEVYEPVNNTYISFRLKERRDATGKALTFYYDAPADGVADRLERVQTADGAEFLFYYDTNHVRQITKVTGPAGRQAILTYGLNSSNDPELRSIEDTVGLVSRFEYDGDHWITSMSTPYGTNSFTHTAQGGAPSNLGGKGIDRSIVIQEPENQKQLYLFYDNPTYDGGTGNVFTNEFAGKIPDTFTTNQLPTLSDLPLQTMDTVRNQRNSHYWGRQQAAALSTNNLAELTGVDFNLSRTRHWLRNGGTNAFKSIRTLGWELPPSQDGLAEPVPVFRDYLGKDPAAPDVEGTTLLPSLITRRMPDGSTWYQSIKRNERGMRTNVIERWKEGSEVLTRTNTFAYATNNDPTIDGLLLLEHRGPGGQLIVGYTQDSTYPDQYATEINGVSEVTTYSYNTNKQLMGKVTHALMTNTYSYDSTSGRLTNVVESASEIDSLTNSYTWTNGFIRTHTDVRGMTRTFDYDFLGRLKKITYPDTSTEEVGYSLPALKGFNTSTNAIPLLDPVSYKDRLNNTWFVYPNRLRQVATLVEPSRTNNVDGVETSFDYCGCGSVTTQIRGANTSTKETNVFEFNYQGRVKRAVFPDQSEVNFTFDALGRPSTRADGYQTLTNVYDNLSRLVLQKNAAGLVQWRGYDQLDRVLQLTNNSGVLITNQFDGIGRLTKQVFPGGVMNQWAYTAGFADATSFTDGENDTTHWQFDPLQRLRKEWVSTIYTNEFIYTGPNLSELKDGKLQSTKWGYDLYGNVTSKTDAANVVIITNAWDANGQMVARWTREKTNLTHFAYDAVGNMTNVDYPTGSDLQFVYNAFSRLTKDVRTGTITNVYAYKSGGALESEETPQWASSKVTLGYTHRLRTSLALQQPGLSDWTHSYVYDNARRLDYISGSSGTFDYSYKSVANQTASRLVNGISIPTATAGAHITNFFDSLGRMTSTVLRNTTTDFNVHSNVLNAAHQPTKQTRFDNSFIDYAYDDAGQLISAKAKESNGSTVRVHEQFGYKYDAAGNLNVRTNNGFLQTFGTNELNQITSVTRSGAYTVSGGTVGNATSVSVSANSDTAVNLTPYADKTFARTNVTLQDGNNTFVAIATDAANRKATNTVTANLPASVSFGYDQNGNLTNNAQITYVYDTENQLVQVLKTSASKSDFVYDARLRRRVRTEASWTGTAWLTNEIVNYVYDGNLVLQERHIHPDTLQVVRLVTYTRGSDLSGSREEAGGIRGMLARTENVASGPTMVAFYHADHVGNITALVNTNQVVIARYLYDPFGRTVGMFGPWSSRNLYRFSSKECHELSGLVYYGYRFYSPELQRWINRDPIGEDGGVNLYGFVSNSPRTNMDPFGECWNPFSPEFWGEGIENAAGAGKRKPVDPNSNAALRAAEGAGIENFEDASGREVSGAKVAALVGGAVMAGTLSAMADIGTGGGRRMGQAGAAALKGQAAVQAAKALGFGTRIAPQRAPFNTHGQSAFFNGRFYITPDWDSHKGGVWKLFSKKGKRVGTCDANLNIIGD